MWKGLIQNFGKVTAMTGLEIHTKKDGNLVLQACSARLQQQELVFEEHKTNLKSLLHFSKQYKPGPIALCLTGKGIITKKIERIAGLDPQVINQILPNANRDLFYFQNYINGDYSWISAIRRTEADDCVAQLAAHGFKVMALSLDHFVLEEVIKPAAGQLEEALWLSYAAAFQLLLRKELVAVAHPGLTSNREQCFAKSRLMAMASVFGVFLLLALLVNFVLFSYYSDRLEALSARSNTTAAELGRLKHMEADIGQKTAFITRAGWTGGLNCAYIADQLIACMPPKISLQDLSINPLNEAASKQKHEEVYEIKTVSVTGDCADASMLNNWIFAIKAKDWVAGCKILNYAINQDDGSSAFAISIQLQGL